MNKNTLSKLISMVLVAIMCMMLLASCYSVMPISNTKTPSGAAVATSPDGV